MTKSELIERIAQKQTQLAYRDVELAVKTVLEHMAERLASGEPRLWLVSDEVYRELLQLDDARLAELRERGVI